MEEQEHYAERDAILVDALEKSLHMPIVGRPYCKDCCETLEGDGYRTVLYCPYVKDESEVMYTTPDDNPIYCGFEEEDVVSEGITKEFKHWEVLHPNISYIAKDAVGMWWGFEEKPFLWEELGSWESCELMCTLHHINPEVFPDIHWKESLIGRPE